VTVADLPALASMSASALGGSLVTLVAFRTKLALMDRRIEARKAETATLRTELTARLHGIERRQIVTLQILADLARKEGVDARWSDALIRFITADQDSEPA
jgi:hypothetical protein